MTRSFDPRYCEQNTTISPREHKHKMLEMAFLK